FSPNLLFPLFSARLCTHRHFSVKFRVASVDFADFSALLVGVAEVVPRQIVGSQVFQDFAPRNGWALFLSTFGEMIMRFCGKCAVGVVLVLLASRAAQAEVKVVVDRNRDADAKPEFKFKNVPSPAKNNLASKATFTIVDGNRDDAGGELDVLNDGKLPTEEDQPETNFFFAQQADGGRLEIDLGKAIDVSQVNTYSWHPNTRGPQVYKLYAADGAAAGFN